MFVAFTVRRFEWDTSYDAEGCIVLLSRFSSPVAMEPWKRERSFTEGEEAADRAPRRPPETALGSGLAHRPQAR